MSQRFDLKRATLTIGSITFRMGQGSLVYKKVKTLATVKSRGVIVSVQEGDEELGDISIAGTYEEASAVPETLLDASGPVTVAVQGTRGSCTIANVYLTEVGANLKEATILIAGKVKR